MSFAWQMYAVTAKKDFSSQKNKMEGSGNKIKREIQKNTKEEW